MIWISASVKFSKPDHFWGIGTDLRTEVIFDIADQPLHLPLLFLVVGMAIRLHSRLVGLNTPLALFERLAQIRIQGKTTNQRVSAFDVDVNEGGNQEMA